MSVPRIGVISLGGTISSVRQESDDGTKYNLGVVPKLGASELVERLGLNVGTIAIEPITLSQVPSASLNLDDFAALFREIERMDADGVDGVVVTQGTDTMEEMSFLVDVVYTGDVPVVFTGAMRDSSSVGADGAANMLSAIATSLSDDARGSGVLVVMNDVIHASRWISKRNTTNLAAFNSATAGPVGWIAEGVPHIAFKRLKRETLRVPDLEAISSIRVALVAIGMGEDGRILAELPRLGYHGAVIQSMGGGHVPRGMMAQVRELVAFMPVVIASRTGAGSVLSNTYGFEGSEIDLIAAGVLSAGTLDSYKARLLLNLVLLRNRSHPNRVRADFENIACSG
jgi:L-asparaginase